MRLLNFIRKIIVRRRIKNVMPFKISAIHHITGKGIVISGKISDKYKAISGDNLFFKNGYNSHIVKIIGIHAEKEKDYFGFLISTNDFDVIKDWKLKELDITFIATTK